MACDLYDTPAWCVDALLTRVCLNGTFVVDPCAGRGAIVNRIKDKAEGSRVEGYDLDTDLCNEYGWRQRDARECKRYNADALVTNPPYSWAQEIVENLLRDGARVKAFLLRLAFLESEKRRKFWSENGKANIYVLAKRPSFTKNGKTDATAYAWFVWSEQTNGSWCVI